VFVLRVLLKRARTENPKSSTSFNAPNVVSA
jgi:hypothetical protein